MAASVLRDGVPQLLCVVHPRMSLKRIEAEWSLIRRTLRPEVFRRMAVQVALRSGAGQTLGEVSPSLAAKLCRGYVREPLPGVPSGGMASLPLPDYRFIVVKLLVHGWLTNRGPTTAKWLGDVAGCSYPTVASATRRLHEVLERRKDRRLELREFPRQEWSRLLTMAEEARGTRRFADRSGRPRSPSRLAERLHRLKPAGVALGGVLAARHYDPRLNLTGLPRLDLSLHCPGRWADLSFLERLDPGLAVTSDTAEPATLVLHFVRHEQPLFEAGADGLPWVDPAECLMDLHEARLEGQAADFVRALRAGGKE